MGHGPLDRSGFAPTPYSRRIRHARVLSPRNGASRQENAPTPRVVPHEARDSRQEASKDRNPRAAAHWRAAKRTRVPRPPFASPPEYADKERKMPRPSRSRCAGRAAARREPPRDPAPETLARRPKWRSVSTCALINAAIRSRSASRPSCFTGLHEAEMAFRQTDFFVARQGPQNRKPKRLDGRAHKPSMARACDPVQDHPGDFDARVEAGAALDNRRRRLRLPAHVEHEQDRPAERRRDIGGGAGPARLARHAVEKPHQTFAKDEFALHRLQRHPIGRAAPEASPNCRD